MAGIVVVEFAIGMLIVVFLMMVAAELGRIFYSYNIVNQSVRTGARYVANNSINSASVFNLSNSNVAQASNLVVSGSINGGTPLLPDYTIDNVTISAEFPSGGVYPYVTVAAAYNYQPLFSGVPNFWAGGAFDFQFTLNATNTMRAIRGE